MLSGRRFRDSQCSASRPALIALACATSMGCAQDGLSRADIVSGEVDTRRTAVGVVHGPNSWCSATLIEPCRVLTAAHCLYPKWSSPESPGGAFRYFYIPETGTSYPVRGVAGHGYPFGYPDGAPTSAGEVENYYDSPHPTQEGLRGQQPGYWSISAIHPSFEASDIAVYDLEECPGDVAPIPVASSLPLGAAADADDPLDGSDVAWVGFGLTEVPPPPDVRPDPAPPTADPAEPTATSEHTLAGAPLLLPPHNGSSVEVGGFERRSGDNTVVLNGHLLFSRDPGATVCPGDSGGPVLQMRDGVEVVIGVISRGDCAFGEHADGSRRSWGQYLGPHSAGNGDPPRAPVSEFVEHPSVCAPGDTQPCMLGGERRCAGGFWSTHCSYVDPEQ